MKKILLALILAMIFVLSFTLCVSATDGNSEVDPQTKSPCEMILGDVDGDGEVTNADVLMIYRYIYNPELYPLPTICVHEFGDDSYYETTVVSATCSSEGYTLYTCKYCGFSYCDEFTEKTAHTFGDWEEMLSFCTARIMMRSCTECDYSMFNIENGDWHKYTSTVVEPTCTNEGYTLHKCETCNLEYRDTFTEKTPHTFGDWEEMTSSCTTKFSMCSCTECGYSTFRTENGDWHKYTSTVVEPTCSARGYTLYSCQNCNSSYKENYVDATGEHTWKELYVITSTCAEKKIVAICTDCNTTQIIEGTPTEEHDYVVTVVPPTIEEQGYTEHTCKICGDSFKDSFVPVIGSVGLEFTSYGDGTCYVSGIGTCTDTDLVIPSMSPKGDRVTRIGPYAFEDCTSLTSVTIGNSVTSISDFAFYKCTSLTSVTIGNSVTSIGEWAFYNCTSLVSVTFGKNSKLTNIFTGAFKRCTSLVNIIIPDSVTSIGSSAFEDCSSLTSIDIPDRITNIGHKVFTGCTKLLKLENGVSYVDKWAVDCDTSAISVSLRSDTVGICDSVFENCRSLTSITLPNSLTRISKKAFNYCLNLTSISIPDSVTSIGDSAFYNCKSLTGVYITDLAKWCEIVFDGSYSSPLYYAHNLYLNGQIVTNVIIPNSVTRIDYGAFCYCNSITSITIPDSVTSIGEAAFLRCTSLTSVTIPDSVTSIGVEAFYSCENLTSITIPDSVTSIGKFAFDECNSLKDVYYTGTQEQWQKISIGSYNSYLTYYATIHYNYVAS